MTRIEAHVRVKMNPVSVAKGLNGVGGPAWRWREATMRSTLHAVRNSSPVNNPLNATGRGHAAPGGFRRGLGANRIGSNQHQLRFTLTNSAEHAAVVELGRTTTHGRESFGWTGHEPPGAISAHDRGTQGRRGTHIMEVTMTAVVAAAT